MLFLLVDWLFDCFIGFIGCFDLLLVGLGLVGGWWLVFNVQIFACRSRTSRTEMFLLL